MQLIDLTNSYKNNNDELIAVKNVNLDLYKRQSISIMGPSGCGKSTFLNLIGLIQKPTSGNILINSVNVNDYTIKQKAYLRNKFFGYVAQNYLLIDGYTAMENVEIPLLYSNQKICKKDRRKKVMSILESVEMSNKAYDDVKELSGGQQQRVAIARALINNPKILLSDEGTSALDPKTTKSILNLLAKARNEFGLTIVLITHQMEVIKDICDRVAIIENGEIIELNTVEEIFANPQTKTAKAFISNLKTNSQEEINIERKPGSKIIRLSFLGENAKQPIVSKMIKKFNVDVNILSGNINELMSTSIGNLIIEISGSDIEIEKSIEWLKKENIRLEVI